MRGDARRGMILGTAAYMSPEQARGDARRSPERHVLVRLRLLYELLTACQAFPGDSVTDILASVLARANLSGRRAPETLDPRLTRLLRRCLAKSPRQRWQAMGDVREKIDTSLAEPTPGRLSPSPAVAMPARPLWARAASVAVAVVLSTAIAGGTVWSLRPKVTSPQVVRFSVPISAESALFTNFNRQVLALAPTARRSFSR